MALIDLHTHRVQQDKNVHAIFNVARKGEGEIKYPCSVGLHPWYLDEIHFRSDLDWLESEIHNPSVLAIGECGLDKRCNVPWDLQMLAFENQIELAQNCKKPLIIHCVKAQQEILQMLKGFQGTFVFHGFNRSLKMAEDIIECGGCISVNAHFLSQPIGKEIALKIDRGRLFLETDDGPESIERAYLCLAEIWEESMDDVEAQMAQNARRWGFNF